MACEGYPTKADALRFKENADAETEFMESASDTFITPEGQSKKTITGLNSAVNAIIADAIANAQRSETITLAGTQTSVSFTGFNAALSSYYVSGPEVSGGRELIPTLDYTFANDNTEAITLASTFPEGTLIYAKTLDVTGSVAAANAESLYIPSNDNNLVLIAHRGFINSFPQNTILAFSAALKRNADQLECDVSVSSDGVPVVFHDQTVDDLTNGTGNVANLTLSQLQALKFTETIGTAYDSVKIPTFLELLQLCKEKGVVLNAEIKEYRSIEDVDLMVSNIVNSGLEDSVVLHSFRTADVSRVRTLNPTIRVALLGGFTDLPTYTAAITLMAGLGRGSIAWNFTALRAVPDIVALANANNVGIFAWTVNTDEAARQMLALGVNHIISDVNLEKI